MSLITALLDSGAAKKENRLKQGLLDKGATISREAFDSRMKDIRLSDARLLELARRGYTDTAANEDQTFADLLTMSREGFDEDLAITDETATNRLNTQKTAFDQQMEALGGLVTAQRGARLKMQEARTAEVERQKGFQAEADGLAEALPGEIGYGAQETARGAAFADRLALIQDSISNVTGPAWATGADGAAYTANAQRGRDVAVGDASAAARVSAYSDAYQGSERRMGRFADDLGELTAKAQLSRSALPAELGVGKLEGEQAKERADFGVALAREMGDRRDQIEADRGAGRSRVSRNFTGARTGARRGYGDNRGRTLDRYFDAQTGAETDFISGLSEASRSLESRLLGYNNFKMGNTRVTSPLANTIRAFEDGMRAAGMGA